MVMEPCEDNMEKRQLTSVEVQDAVAQLKEIVTDGNPETFRIEVPDNPENTGAFLMDPGMSAQVNAGLEMLKKPIVAETRSPNINDRWLDALEKVAPKDAHSKAAVEAAWVPLREKFADQLNASYNEFLQDDNGGRIWVEPSGTSICSALKTVLTDKSFWTQSYIAPPCPRRRC